MSATPPGPPGPVHVVGASGRSGAALCRALLDRGTTVAPVVRDAARWRATGLPGTARVADLTGPAAALAEALAGATRVASTAHARHVPALLAAMPADAALVCLGSTRKFTRWPDAHGNGVLAGEAALLSSGRNGAILHPTMIYGAQGENNVQRLAALMRRLPVIPLPQGGRSLVQPIHQDDVTRSLLAALERRWEGPHALVIAGGTAVAYRDFAAMVARRAGLRPRAILPVPMWTMRLAALATGLVPGLPTVGAAEIRRLLEDKAFDIGPMQRELGLTPMTLEEGLSHLFPT
ncbi:NADH-ubiquinone oxidoreductase 39-40 kDa subunit [Gluconacetobacter johannae DSM 13595]|uniref:NADH-ubiquinone oxidoreductase n=1 Tax=Gluconacetobacter johannae TaxID=112140 RepID=A0A7W4J8U1_9PROT|nr:NAD(P)H-binding protein [Gluconacetobacter johannae]MBB2176821.1 NADH-ubiquinone oxidoreductase [Gluconacetobacter johannae]GBQ85786.1 NADH-ubiquinone oxidoreductase 39-40 kDa subunit [Gluconacetobacter johannae DSM 13595]